ncbi:MAG: 1,2-phenylacetyl-CoA epoxidase subunit PaaD [Bacteroidota bacterium]|nr:phenylacetate-CoA oxygenase subunit PaaJ [Candidatus Kapabacteria bacterium]MCS7302528.1 phenylacetate-CoA oxygenase subunit PaaJ [Candidatus Kapabacteria bacterium]MCX7936786.1 phenylacetate-CoA oxygenase subunit PaaJ [Chlorobiota bacterium]MDW8074170.1 1,2-phenylacetyl-CoA epoxidase subunit PaaD [Bacteroidota bacterium]MDW8271354.1 1,2-phenylacetyl-CoA epoxidase subunit PaaD [Bacteroidota bacterium]
METSAMVSREDILGLLEQVHDPEIPMLSVVDMGIVSDIEIEPEKIHVILTPTFVGCPAIELIRSAVREKLSSLGVPTVEVTVDYTRPWSTNRLSERGRQILAQHGFAPPPRYEGDFEPEILLNAACPYCGSTNTQLRTPFGPALCRAIYYCNDCRQAFEQFKPL